MLVYKIKCVGLQDSLSMSEGFIWLFFRIHCFGFTGFIILVYSIYSVVYRIHYVALQDYMYILFFM